MNGKTQWKMIKQICQFAIERAHGKLDYPTEDSGAAFEARSVLDDPRRARIELWAPQHEFARGRVRLLKSLRSNIAVSGGGEADVH